MAEHRNKHSSKHFYAINFNNIPVEVHGTNTEKTFEVQTRYFPAVWFKTKRGLLTVSEGHLHHCIRSVDAAKYDDVEEMFVNEFDGRYGGTSRFQWDGERMYAPKQSFADMAAAQERLQVYLDLFPNVPEGYKGWYSIN